MFASAESVEKCRLEGHLLDISEAYETRFPWIAGGGGQIHLRSSMALEPKIYMNISSPNQESDAITTTTAATNSSESRFTKFTRAVRARMLSDLKLLPVRDPSTHFVERQNVTVYTNYRGRGLNDEVLIVYAPTSLQSSLAGVIQPQQLEFISFVLLA